MEAIRQTMRSTVYKFIVFSLRLLTGFFLGLTLAFIAQEIIQFGMLGFLLLVTVVTASFLKISLTWSMPKILVFDLICVLVGQILKMYILLAPG